MIRKSPSNSRSARWGRRWNAYSYQSSPFMVRSISRHLLRHTYQEAQGQYRNRVSIQARESGAEGRDVEVCVTNVWVSGLISPLGPPGRILRAVRDGLIEAVASWDLAGGVGEGLRGPELARYGIAEQDVREVLVLLAPLLPDVDVDVEPRDPEAVPVIAAAVAGAVDALVTGDRGLVADTSLTARLEARGRRRLPPA